MTTINARNHSENKNPNENYSTGVVPLRKNTDYLKWFISDIAADAGSAVLSFATPLIALAVTGSLSLTGIITGLTALARVLAIVPGGILADRYDRKKLLLFGHALGSILWIAGIGLFFSDTLNTITLTILCILAGVRDGLFGAVSTPALRQLVPPTQLPQALAANQARDGTIQLVSGPAGGFLVALAIWVPFAARAIAHVLAWISVRTIKADLKPAAAEDTSNSPLKQITAGFTWLARHRTITTILVIAALLSFAISGAVQTIVLNLAHAQTDATSIGLVPSALATGMIVGSVVAGPIARRFPTGIIGISSVGAMCATLALLACTDNFLAILVILALASIALPIFNSAASGWAISQIPDAKMGVISSSASLLNLILIPIAPLIAGVGLDRMDYFPTMATFILVMLASAVAMALTGEFRRLPRPNEW